MQDSAAHNILVIGPAWVGDMVMAQTLFKLLRQTRPGCNIDVQAPAWTQAVTVRMPEVRNGLGHDLRHGEAALRKRYRLGKSLREAGYAEAFVLPNSLKSALIPFWAGIPRRTGYVGELRYLLLNDARRLDKKRLPRTVDRFAALAFPPHAALPETLPEPRLQVNPATQAETLESLGLSVSPQRPALALCPGAEYGPAKRWPPEYFAAVAKRHLAQGGQVWIFGSGKDIEAAAAVQQASGGGCINLCGRTSLEQAIDLLALSATVITNDSGLMHVAAALDVPLVAIYGSSDPGFTPPLSAKATVLRLGLECSPCFQRTCRFGHYRCLREITPEQAAL